MTAYYNEIDPYCAQWLRNLVAAGLIPAGDVDERPIEEVSANDVRPYTQAHFFAGIGGWAYAARLAGWPDDRPLWTGSCPCQPFSAAGKRGGVADERHLWPAFWWLINTLRPPVVAGEQVASKDGRTWLAGVRTDLEALGYAVGAADLCAAGVGAPHIRQRLWWVADADSSGVGTCTVETRRGVVETKPGCEGAFGGSRLGHALEPRLEGHAGHGADGHEPGRQPEDAAGSTAEAGGHNWGDFWIPCADGKARRIESGIEPLVDGFPGRVDQVRAYGNSICPQEAAEFLTAYIEATEAP